MELDSMWLRGMSPAMVTKAKEELGEMPDYKHKCLMKFRTLIEGDDGFEPLITDAFLLRFLRAKKYDVKRAHKTLKNYYAYKSRYSGLLTDFMPSELWPVWETNNVFVSPKRCSGGCGLFMVFLGAFDVESLTAEKFIAATVVAAEIGTETEGSQVCGSQIVVDMQGMTWTKMKYFSSPVLLSRVFRGLQDCWPYRITAIHGTHEPSYYGIVYNLVKTMLSKKLRDRVHFHGDNMESLQKFIPPEALPKRLGGTLGEKDFLNFRTLLQENEHIMKNINKYVFQGVKSPKYDAGPTDGDTTLIIPKVLQST